MSKYLKPELIISVDGEAATLAGSVFAIGAAVIECGTGRVVDRYMGRLTRTAIDKLNPGEFTKQNVIEPTIERWKDIAFVTESRHVLHAHFFAWWRCWVAGTTRMGVDSVLQHHCSASGGMNAVAISDVRTRVREARAYEGLLHGDEILTVADWGFPVEQNLFFTAIQLSPDFEFFGPTPLHEISTLRLAAKLAAPRIAPTSQRYQSIGGVEHNPLDDAIISGLECEQILRILRHAGER